MARINEAFSGMQVMGRRNPANSIDSVAIVDKELNAAVAGGVEKSKGDDQHLMDRNNIAEAALRQQVVSVAAPSAASGGEGATSFIGYSGFSKLPDDVVCDVLMQYLDGTTVLHLSQASSYLKGLVTKALENAQKRLETMEGQINELIKNSNIAGIEMPVTPFANSIHKLRVLTDFKENLPNAIAVFNANNIRNIKASDKNGRTPFHIAAEKRCVDIAQALIDSGAYVDASDKNGRTPLYIAAEEGCVYIAQALIAAGADVNACDKNGWSPLYLAAYFGFSEVAKLLIDSGVDVDASDKNGRNPLDLAAKNDHLQVVNLLKNAIDLFNYCEIGKPISDSELLSHVNFKVNGKTPLHMAVIDGSIETVQVLINAGADVNARDKNGRSPLYVAVTLGRLEVVKLLIAAGSVVNARDKDGFLPLHAAAYFGCTEIAKLLIDRGADVQAWGGYEGWTPLYFAVSHGHTEVFKLLIDCGACVNPSNNGGSLLYGAVSHGHTEVFKLLIELGIDENEYKENGFSWLYLAASKGHIELVKFLIDRGSDLRATDKYGRTPRDMAAKRYHTEVVEILRAAENTQSAAAAVDDSFNENRDSPNHSRCLPSRCTIM